MGVLNSLMLLSWSAQPHRPNPTHPLQRRAVHVGPEAQPNPGRQLDLNPAGHGVR